MIASWHLFAALATFVATVYPVASSTSSTSPPPQGRRILLMPSMHGGHVNFFSIAGAILKRDGYRVDALITKEFEQLMSKQNFTTYIVADDDLTKRKAAQINDMVANAGGSTLSMILQTKNAIETITTGMNGWCQKVLDNEHIMNELRKKKYDMAIIDGIDFASCLYIIANNLGIRYITINARHEPWASGLPISPGAEGLLGINVLPEHSTILQRFRNLFMYTATHLFGPKTLVPKEMVSKYTDTNDIYELYKRAEFFFVNRENIFLDFPRLYAPHYRFLGGLGAHPAESLTPDLQKYIKSAGEEGIIVLSFGSAISSLSKDLIKMIFEVLGTFKCKVLMRLVGDFEDVPKNVKIMKWLPQNDLLGDKNVRLFITHAGANGIAEGFYHAVPMLFMPIFGDMVNNAHVAAGKGFGIIVLPTVDNKQAMKSAVEQLLPTENNSYRLAIQQASQKYHSLPQASDEFKFWVNHTIIYGGDHLKPKAYNQSLYKSFMLDIFFILFGLSLVLLYLSYVMCKCVLGRCFRRFGSSKSQILQTRNSKKNK